MCECSSESASLVNAEVDSMGGIIDSRVGIGIRTSPSRAEIEKAQEEIRLEIDCREERLRELEFLEKGGDPLDFKFTHAVSVSVQSTSLTDQRPEQIVTSKVNESYASEPLQSPHGEAVESFGKPGGITCEGNSGDNLLLFDGENKVLKDKNSKGRAGKNTAAPEISTRTGGNHNAKGSRNSAVFRPYARRNRSKSRDNSRLASADSHARNQGSTHFRPGTRDAKGSLSDANRKDQKLSSICKLKSSSRTGEVAQKNDSFHDVESVVIPAEDKLASVVHGSLTKHASDVKTNGDLIGCKKGHDNCRDASCCGAGIEAEESSELANCGSLVCDGTPLTQQTGNANDPDVLAISKKTECPLPDRSTVNLDIQTPNSVRDSSAYLVNGVSNEHCRDPMLVADEGKKAVTEDALELKIKSKPIDPSVFIGGESMHHDIKSRSVIKVNKDVDLQNKSVTSESLKTSESKEPKEVEVCRSAENVVEHNSSPRNGDTAEVRTSITPVLVEVSETIPSGGATTNKDVPDTACNKKLTDKMDEDSLLAEAKIILGKRRRIAEISLRSLPLKNCQKSQWNFLLEEMAWLANDYMQERLWKITAAAQLGRHSSLASRVRDRKQIPVRRLKFVAHSVAKAVMEFWHACEMLVNESCNSTAGIIAPEDGPDSLEPQSPRSCKSFALKSYALRFLRYSSSAIPSIKQEDSLTSNDMHDLAVQEKSGESCIAEDALFYVIPPGAMQCYRTSIESYVLQCEKNGSIQKEDDTLIHETDEVIMEMSQDNVYEEDEGETSTYCVPGTVEWSKASQFPHKKQKGNNRTYSSGSYKPGPNVAYGSHMRGVVRRPATQNLVSIPTKRMRTASRQRVLGSSSGTGIVNMLATEKDGSSEDTNSYQDEQSSLHGGSQLQRSLEVESPVDFENYLPNDSEETSSKQKKKKTSKNMGDHSKRRWDSHHFDSNGCDGLFGQHKNKKLKVSKQTLENVLDYGAPMSGSIPSPIPSQMSNMSNVNEYKRMIANRDRLKKVKVTKLQIPIPGSGNGWTSFEDQALVVLVHDLGPNWHLVSDAINSTLRLKHIFREPKECKERHKLLMDQTAGDGADSAEDSGSSQPYPSTMPGIPKGSARQLFQRLHGPMEEDMVKSHFEKIIMIGQKQRHRQKQRDPHDQEQVSPPHNSHVIAISQVSSNNPNGGFLTPHDLIDAIMSSPDALALGYQCPQTNGFTNQSCVPSVLPPPGMPAGNNLSSPSGPLSHRNGRYGGTSLSTDDHQRVQQLNPLLSNRNIQQSTSPVTGLHPVADRFGPHKLHGGNGMTMVNGINSRGKPMSRPGFQGLGSSAVLSSGMGGMPSLEMQPVIGSNTGNSVLRHMDNSHQIRPGQKMVPDVQMRAAQANSHPITTVNGLSGSYTGQTGSSPAQPFSLHTQQKPQKSLQQSCDITSPHPSHLRGPIGPQNPAYARMVKERQLQQQRQMMIQQQQQQYYASNAIMPQAHPQLPVMQKSPMVQPQHSSVVSHPSQSPSASLTPIYSQPQQKHHLPPHGYSRDSHSGSSGIPNQMIKQCQRHPQQQQQQSVRPHSSQELQQLHSQHVKQFKGEGNVNMNTAVDQSNLNGKSPSTSPGGQSIENGEQAVQALGSQTSSESQLQQKLYSPVSKPPNQMLPVPPLLDNERTLPWQVTESLQDSPMQNISGRLGSIGSPRTAPPGSDSSLIAGPGSIRKQLSGGLTSSANSVGEKWQQKTPTSPQQE